MRSPRPTPIAARNNTGLSKLENTLPRHNRRNTRASRSTTRTIGGTLMSFLERAAGEDEEHVFETAAAHERRLGCNVVVDDRGHGGVAAVCRDEHNVGERVEAFTDGCEPPQRPLLRLLLV